MTENWTELYKKDRKICDCEECRSGKYDPKDYMLYEEDLLRLDHERPLGLTGHLRAKNEALSVGQCIESCIDFLDELIITYNDSEDETAEIIQKYADKYPNKIRAYHYKTNVVVNTWTEFGKDQNQDTTSFRDSNSIHNPANYYNFGYTKTSYRYYVKIDADQIYFTEKMLKIKQMIFDQRRNGFNKIFNKILVKLPYIISNLHKKIMRRLFITKYLCINFKKFLSDMLMADAIFMISGINVWTDGQEILFQTQVSKATPYIINGFAGDHVIWTPNSEVRYYQDPYHYYERIDIVGYRESVGLCWVHVREIKINNIVEKNNINVKSMLEIATTDKNELLKGLKDEGQKIIISNFWDKDRNYITQEFYNKYFPSILEYYQKNIMNK